MNYQLLKWLASNESINRIMIINKQQLSDILIKDKKISRRELFRIFLKEFNQEAKIQNSKWFAEVQNIEDKREDYHFLFISKYVGWFIFKEKISVHARANSEGYYDFVDNDFICGPYGKKFSDKFFRLFPEFKLILERIPIKVFILKDNSFEALNNELNTIEREVEKNY